MAPKYLLVASTLFAALLCSQWALAGGGPENVCVVVNPNSAESMAIANHFIHLRHVPPDNVIYLPWKLDQNAATIDMFRDKILRPILATLQKRNLTGQIDCIVYSSDLPWIVNFQRDITSYGATARTPPGMADTWQKMRGNCGSTSGLTYLYHRVLHGGLDYTLLDANRYMRPMIMGRQVAPTMGFSGTTEFNDMGQPVASGGERYVLSMMLAITENDQRRGTTAGEAMACLKRSLEADGTHPTHTIYYTLSKDIRTRARARDFRPAVEALDELGVAAEVVRGDFPSGKDDVLGLTCGTAFTSWDGTGSAILPGAICDNLTSYGGSMNRNSPQIPLTDFLLNGAAGASGTVVEPYLTAQLLAKFPNPMIQVHYARGCSLAEAFYQAVHAPYQLLIVGDPLCQPFASIPVVEVAGLEPGQRISGTLSLAPTATIPPKPPADESEETSAEEPKAVEQKEPTEEPKSAIAELLGDAPAEQVDRFELFADGARVAVAKPGGPLTFDTTRLGDGYHELRVVAVGPAPIHTQGRKIVWVVTSNHGRAIAAAASAKRVAPDGNVTVMARSPGAKRIEIRHNGRVLGTIDGHEGRATIDAAKLGGGFNFLRVVGVDGDGPQGEVYARPIVLWVG